ncbi:MFS transporter [Cellulomonas sp. PhB143]|uniref:MFS transporter n=1 Tax=Cellulomonas sp. PhB143 TaxID=2485186 RepID=UPI000F49959B|nr:MFS transporter [Cellulomonas sp. PhB143]ROS77019.1 Na+/melibiose symporter-like transporter [Cellulomonas sp. PhB143]
MTLTTPALSRARTARYAAGSVGTGGFSTLPGLVLLYYLTDARAVPALAAGLIVTVAKVWDVAIAPVVGHLSDRDLARTGSRRRLMLWGGSALPVLFALTFAVPAGTAPSAAALWVFVAFWATGSAFSLFQVPYVALPAEIAPTYDDRTRLLAWRVALLAVSILAFGAGGPLLRGESDDAAGYLRMGIVSGLVIGAGMLVAVRAAPRPSVARAVLPRARPTAAVADGFRTTGAALRRSAPFRALFGTFVLQALATGVMLAGAQYVATYVLDSEAAVSILFAALIAPALLAMPLWTRLAARTGKERAYAVASVLFVAATLAMVPLVWAPGPWVYAPTALAGVAYAGMQALPLAMLPDVIEHDARSRRADPAAGAASGTAAGRAAGRAAEPAPDREGGAFSGAWTAGETTAMALGGGALSLVLAVTGFLSTDATSTAVQPGSALTGISLAFSVLPAALTAASLLTLARYRLRRSDFSHHPPEES